MLIKSDESYDDDDDSGTVARPRRHSLASDLHGLVQLGTDAVHLTTGLVEAQHSRLDWFSNLLLPARSCLDKNEDDKVRNPIAALVYNSIYTVNSIVGTSLEWVVVSLLEPLLPLPNGVDDSPSFSVARGRRRQAALAILNGVVGDYLTNTGNPLAIVAHWSTAQGHDIDSDNDKALQQWIQRQHQPNQTDKARHLLILVHGSCNGPHDWWQDGHNYGVDLANDQVLNGGEDIMMMQPLFWHYNTGLHISENGQLLAHALDRLVRHFTSCIDLPLSLSIVAHSMGGLVARSACHYVQVHNGNHHPPMLWLEINLRNMVFLGSPHHGATLERGGKLVDAVLGAHRLIEPISWLGKIRSNGVTDLGYGNIREEDWIRANGGMGDYRVPTPLPEHVRCCAIAAVNRDAKVGPTCPLRGDTLQGDGLVAQSSALGIGHENPEMNLKFAHHTTIFKLGHVGLLGSLEVYREIRSFLTNSGSSETCELHEAEFIGMTR